MVAITHALLTYYSYYQGWLWVPLSYLHLFYILFFAINIGILIFARSASIMKVERHQLVFTETLWAQIYLIAISFFFTEMRFVMFTPAIISLSFAAFRIPLNRALILYFIAVVGYGVGCWYRGHMGVELEFHNEITELGILSLIGFAMVFIGHDIFNLRKVLKNKNEEIKSALKRIEDIAIYDELTDVYNRKHLYDVMNRFAALSQRKEFVFSICYVDIDNFDSINQSFGHVAGDEVLVMISKLITGACRASDICGRFSGEEFVLVLPETNMQQAQVLARRINKQIKELRFASIHYMLQVTVSIGIAEYDKADKIDDLVRRAEEALRLAKQTGKDRVFTFEKEDDEQTIETADDNVSAKPSE